MNKIRQFLGEWIRRIRIRYYVWRYNRSIRNLRKTVEQMAVTSKKAAEAMQEFNEMIKDMKL